MKQKKRVLVIGGAGFLGSHVADSLSEQGHEVTIYDMKKSRYLRKEQKQIIGDILDEAMINKALKGIQVVYHMAGISDIEESFQRPVDTVKFNILGTTIILEACLKNKIEKFLFASSAYVYSDSGSFYRISKQACELIIEGYAEKGNLPYVILRYGSLYGERADRRNSIFRMLEDALTTGKISYAGDGSEKREFIHVKDAADLSVEALQDRYNGQNLILTGVDSINYSELLKMLNEMMHGKLKIEFKKNKSKTHYALTPYSFNPKLGRKLVTNPHIDLGQGLLNMISQIHHDLHPELKDKFGLLVNEK